MVDPKMSGAVKSVVLVHIPFSLGYRASGGGIRPQKMIDAFQRQGHEVMVVAGSHAERAKTLAKILRQVQTGEVMISFIYSESSANPTVLTDKRNWYRFRDFYYLYRLARTGIPVGLFYRDCHWNFAIAQKKMSALKWWFLKMLHRLDLLCYLTFVDTLFLPSVRMCEHIPWAQRFANVDELPPGHDVLEDVPDRDISQFPKCIYVGGVLPPVYDLKPLLAVAQNYSLTICCREDEWLAVKEYYGELEQKARIVHLSGLELEKELKNSHVAIVLREHHDYLNFSQPLKFYEAIGFELPLLVSPGNLVAEQVEDWGVGWVCSDPKLTFDFSDYQEKVQRLRQLKPKFTWESRVTRLVEQLQR